MAELQIKEFCIPYYEEEFIRWLICKGAKKTKVLKIARILSEVMKYSYPSWEESFMWKLIEQPGLMRTNRLEVNFRHVPMPTEPNFN